MLSVNGSCGRVCYDIPVFLAELSLFSDTQTTPCFYSSHNHSSPATTKLPPVIEFSISISTLCISWLYENSNSRPNGSHPLLGMQAVTADDIPPCKCLSALVPYVIVVDTFFMFYWSIWLHSVVHCHNTAMASSGEPFDCSTGSSPETSIVKVARTRIQILGAYILTFRPPGIADGRQWPKAYSGRWGLGTSFSGLYILVYGTEHEPKVFILVPYAANVRHSLRFDKVSWLWPRSFDSRSN